MTRAVVFAYHNVGVRCLKVLLAHGGNIEDSHMTILRGHFMIMLIVSAPDAADPQRLRSDLQEAGAWLGLDAILLSEVPETEPPEEPVPSHIVSVYGIDHPGIVHAVSSVLAEQGVSITDLTTRLFGGENGEQLYAMMLEIAPPAGLSADEVEDSLRGIRDEQGVELTVRPLEQDTL